jgi:hypothetical protein
VLKPGSATGVDTLEIRAFNGAYWGDWAALAVTLTSTPQALQASAAAPSGIASSQASASALSGAAASSVTTFTVSAMQLADAISSAPLGIAATALVAPAAATTHVLAAPAA